MQTTQILNTWMFIPKPIPQAQLRLICFAHAGGGAAFFRTWPHHLPDDIEVWAMRLPGRENRFTEASFTQMSSLVEVLIDVLEPHLTIPFALFGHSLGAIISFELARRLRQKQLPDPVHLFVSGHRAPQIPQSNLPLYQLSDDQFVENLKTYNGISEEVLREPELMQLMLPMLRADFTIVDTYSYTPKNPLRCPISAFAGQEDDKEPVKDMEPWYVQTMARFKMRTYPGDHFFLREVEPQLLQAIVQDLAML